MNQYQTRSPRLRARSYETVDSSVSDLETHRANENSNQMGSVVERNLSRILSGSSTTPHQAYNDSNLIADIRSIFSPLLKDISITDIPYRSNNGLVQYRHDDNHQKVRARRVKVAKEFGMNLGDAVNDRNFQLSLADRVSNERDAKNKLFGQCAEMAYLAASKLEGIAKQAEYNVFTFQQPDANHTITLFSKNGYTPNSLIDWKKEHESGSLVIDLWQGTLSPNTPSALVNHSLEHLYTRNNPRSVIQAEIWGFSQQKPIIKKQKNSILKIFNNLFK
ncbi:hypothetical protein SMETH9_04490 [Serratia marcescens]|nr:hypothetical protein SMETH9_04490 [Serratia marcescens]